MHAVDEFPMLLEDEDVFEFNGGKHIEALITASVITIDDDLASLDIALRSCYMKDERQLKFFKTYSKRNCEIECFSNLTKEICKCVPYDVIRDQETELCGLDDAECVNEQKRILLFSGDTKVSENCSCLDTCNLINYDVEYFVTKLSDP